MHAQCMNIMKHLQYVHLSTHKLKQTRYFAQYTLIQCTYKINKHIMRFIVIKRALYAYKCIIRKIQ